MKPWSVEQLCLAGACTLPVLTGAAVLLALRQPQPAPFAQLLATALLGLLPAALLLLIHRRASARLTLNVGRYQHLFNSAHEGLWQVAPDGRTLRANARLGQMLGVDAAALPGRSLHDFLGHNAPQLLERLSGDALVHDVSVLRADGQHGWAIVSARAMPGDEGMLLMLTDISERKAGELALASVLHDLDARIAARTAELRAANEQLRKEAWVRREAETALARSEQQLQDVISTMPVPLFIRDAASRVILMNQAAEQQWGVPFNEIVGTRGSAWCPPEQLASQLANDRDVFARGALQVRVEEIWNHAFGANRLIQSFKKPVYDAAGEPLHLICMAVDITDQKRDEDALRHSFVQLRQLTEHLEMIKEEERKRIALEIHDELGQNLMALRLDAEMLNARAGARHPHLRRRVGQVIDTLDATIRSVRAIINELHPSTLALGLEAALEWLLAQFEQRSGIAATLSFAGGAAPPPDTRLTAVVFRIIQEALVNIVRHAQATHVEVALTVGDEELSITIIDDGVGMPPGETGKAAGFGLRSIRERVDVFGGELCINGRPGQGTTLSIHIPHTATVT